MRILILGGTQFLGHEIAQTLLAARHRVTIFNRGKSPDDLRPDVERLRGDRDEGASGLTALRGRHWDVCIDTSGFTPRQVRPSAELLRASIKRYVFMSAVSVYGDPQDRPVRETHPLLPPAREDVTEIDGDTYGPLKVACESIVQEIFTDHCTLLRPQIVVGPRDDRARLQYWVQRPMEGGELRAPGDGSDHLQYIDVRDVARFVKVVIEKDLSGPFNLSGPRLKWSEFMNLLAAKKVAWVPAKVLESTGVTESELPLFRRERGPRSGLMDVSNEKATAAGLVLTPPNETIRFVRESSNG